MRSTILFTILATFTLVLSGCIVGPSDDADPAPQDDDGDPGTGDNTTADPGDPGDPGGNTSDPVAPHAAIAVSGSSGTVPFEVVFDLSSEDSGAEFMDWNFDADGDDAADESGYGLPAEVAFTYEEAGDYTATLYVTDVNGEPAETSVDIEVVPEPPVVLPAPMTFYGNITGFFYEPAASDTHTFNVSVPLEKITFTFGVGTTAVDIDYRVFAGGNEVGSRGAENEPTGTVFPAAEPDIEITDQEVLSEPAEWRVEVRPFVAVDGEYTVTVTFE